MADRRMFSKNVTETDPFLEVSLSAQAIYLHECQAADDDGFIASAKKTLRASKGTEEMLQELVDTGYLIRFDTGIYLVTHWNESNHVQKDRYKPTIYTKERSLVDLVDNVYYLKTDPNCIQNGSIPDTQVRLEEKRLDKKRLGESLPAPTPTTKELMDYAEEIDYPNFNAEKFLAYYNANGWKNSHGKPITDWKNQILVWKAREKDYQNHSAPGSIHSFSNQNTYDFESLEKDLLAN